MKLSEIALRLAAIKAVDERLTKMWEDVRALAAEELDAGDRKAAKLPSGTTVGNVSKTDPKPTTKAKVVDEAAFLKWVKKNRKSAIVERVRESDQRSILEAIDETGEIPDGVDLVESCGRPNVTVTQTEAQRDALVAAWRAGEIELPDVLAIEAGEPS